MQIIRTYSTGVFAGDLDESTRSADGKRGIVRNARRLWKWSGAASLSDMAINGVSNPTGCKFPAPVEYIELMEIIEVLPCTEQAVRSISEVPVWTMH